MKKLYNLLAFTIGLVVLVSEWISEKVILGLIPNKDIKSSFAFPENTLRNKVSFQKRFATAWSTAILLLFVSTGALAQTAANYGFSISSGTYTPITVAGGATSPSTAYADDINHAITGLTAFNYNGTNYTNYQMNSNGRLILYGTTPPTTTTTYTPLSSSITNAGFVIAPFGADLAVSTAATSGWLYQTIGTELIFQWDNVSRYSSSGNNDIINFQIRLNTSTGSITFVYGSQTVGSNPTATPQVGIRSGSATTWSTDVNNLMLDTTGSPSTCTWANAVTGNANNSTVRFAGTIIPSSGLTYTWTKQSAVNTVRTFTAVSGISPTGATINWTAATGATGYNVQYRTNGSTCGWTNWSGNPVTTNSATLAGLSQTTTYQVRVQAINGSNTATYSHIPNQAGTGNGYVAAGTFTTTTSSPTLSATTLSAFGNVCINTTSAANSFTLTGANLTGNVTVGALTGYTYSTTSTGTYTTTLSLSPTSGAISQAVYVKLSPTAIQSYSGNIPVSGGGATAINVAATGAGVDSPPTLSSNGTAGSLTLTAATITGSTISALGCSTITDYGIEYSTTSGFSTGSGTRVSGTGFSGSAGGTFSTSLAGLTANTTYFYRSYATNTAGRAYYTSQSSFSTLTMGQIGSGTATSTVLPINSCWGYNYSQQIYLASEITPIINAGETYITRIRFQYVTAPTDPSTFTNWTVYMGNTTQSVFTGTSNWVPYASLSQVFTGNLTFTAGSWVELTLNTPFLWDGTSNLVVAVDENTPLYSCTAAWGSYTASSNRGMVTYSDDTNPDPASPPAATAGPTASLAKMQIVSTTPPSCMIPTGIALSNITTTSVRADWTAPSVGTTPVGYQWEIRTSGAPGSGTTGLATRANATSTSVEVSTLSPLTTYTFYIRTNCGSSTYSDWTSGTVFTTAQLAGTMPLNDGFEGTVNWSIVNGSQTNKWFIGTAASSSGTKSLYVSNDNGTTNAYNADAPSIVHAYRDIEVPAGTTTATLSFNYRGNGEIYTSSYYDYMRVRIIPTSTIPAAGTELATGTLIGGYFGNQATWQSYINSALDLSAYAGQTVRLVFTWTNDDSVGTNPSAAVDNVVLLVPSCFVPSAPVSSAVTTTTATIGWTAPSTAPSNGYDYILSTTNTTPADTDTPTANVSGTSASLTSLTSATTYYWWVRSNCGALDGHSLWVSGGSFSTAQVPATLPLTENFEGTVNWSIVNGTQVNKWYVGTAANNGGTKAAYISNDNGTSNTYDVDNTSVVHIYRDITIPAGTTLASLGFDWRAYGEASPPSYWDYMRVWVIPVATTPTAGTQISSGTQVGGNFSLQSSWQTYLNPSLDLSAFAGQTARLVFEWRNDGSAGTTPPAAVDNVTLTIPTCLVPSGLSASAITTTTATISWTAPSTVPSNGYEYYVSTSSTAPTAGTTPTGTATGTTASLTSLNPSTTYYWWVRSNCGTTDGNSVWTGSTFNTVCGPVTTLPWTENFDSMTTLGSNVLPNCWTNDIGSGTFSYTSANAASNTYNDPRSTPNYVTIYYPSNNNSFLWTPGFSLTAGVSYTFSFYYAGDNTSGWTGQVYQNTTPSQTGATQLGANFLQATTTTTNAYTQVTRTFVPTTTGTYYFAVAANVTTTSPWYLGFDDFNVSVTPSGISGFNPTATCSVGGETITILGTNLSGASAVTFNGTPAASFSVVDNSTVTAVTPAGVTTGPIVITTPLNTASSSTNLTVVTNPTVADITGTTTTCSGSTTTLSSATAGGTWTSDNTAVATVDATSGVVTGVSAGTATITYTVTTSGCSSSKTATVTVYGAPSISSVTSTQAVTPGATATYTVSATGSGLTYQWEINTGSGWSSVTDDSTYAGATTATLTVSNTTLAMDGYLFRVVVSGTAPCTPVTSSPASTLYVSQVGITANPADVTNCSTTTTASFTATATGSGLSYQWQESTNGGSTWANVTNGTTAGVTYAGATTTTLSLSDLTLANSGYKYRIVVTDVATNSATSNDATLTINQAAAITTQPTSQYACFGTASTKTFAAPYTGAGTIEWQYSANGTTWASVANATPAGVTYTGATTSSLGVATSASTAQGTYYFRAVITAAAPCSNVTSDVVTLTVGLPTVTASASASTYCNPGTGVTLTAGGASTYVWSPATGLSATSGSSVVATPTTTTTYTVTGTDANGCTGTATVTVNVSNTPSATAIAAASQVCVGETVQLDVNSAVAFTTPAVSSYSFNASSGTFTQVSAAATAVTNVLADDVISAALPIGFTFNYGGNNYTQFKMSSNGFMSFNTSATDTGTNNLSTANAAIRPIIAPLWDDLDGRPTGATAFAGYELTGTAPNRVLTVEWRNWEWNYQANAAVISFQVKLYEGSNNVEFVYRSEAGTVTSGSATIGIGAPTGNGSNSYLNLTSVTTPAVSSTSSTTTLSAKPATGTIYRFSPGNAPALTYAWTSSPAGFTSNVKNPVATVSENTTYTVTVTGAGGCATTSNVTVNTATGGTITSQPTGTTICQGGNFTLSVTATGPGLTYQWKKGSSDISGATNTTYTVTGATPADSADYTVVVTPTCGSAITSDVATVLVNPTPTATAPANVSVCADGTTAAITLVGTPSNVTFDVTGGTAIGLADLTGVTTIPAFTPTATGIATITLTPKANGCTGTPVTFTITVNAIPTAITITPSTTTVCNGSVATLTATGGKVTSSASVSSGTVSLAIPDNSATGVSQILAVSGIPTGATVTKVDVTFSINHAWLNDVEVALRAPNGKYIILVADKGAAGAGAFTNTVITSDNTAAALTTTTATSITGTYRANALTTGVIGTFGSDLTATFSDLFTTANGNWTVIAYDDAGSDVGTLVSCSIAVSYENDGLPVWSPTTGLYTDAAATTAYTGGAAATVYASPSATTTYTATVTNAASCTRSNTVTINTGSTSAPTASDQQFCPGATVASLVATGTNIQWYAAATGGTALSSSTVLVSGPYYASQTVNGCESTRTGIVVTLLSSWTGAVDSSWTTAGNWCGNTVPTAGVDVIIPDVTNLPVLAAGQTGYAHNLTLGADATLTVSTGATLSVDNVLAVHPDGTLIVQNNGALIQGTSTVTSNNSGSIDFTKNSSSLYRLDYTLWASPVAGQNLALFAPQTSTNRFYAYNTATDQYANVVAESTNFADATSYLIRMPNGDAISGYNAGTTAISVAGNFVGAPHNGTVTKTLSTAGNGYNAVGNPYPSPINVSNFFSGNNGIIDASSGIYLWRKKNNGSSSSYATLTLAAFTANPSTGGGSENSEFYVYETTTGSDNWLLAPAQGFIVKTAATTGTPTLSFTNAMRRPTPGSTQSFFRPGADTASRLWLNLTGNGAASQTAVAYMDNATLGLDYGYDGNKFTENNTLAFYSLAQNNALAIQARPAFVNSDVVPMGYLAPTAGTHTIAIDHVEGVFTQGQTIYLRDNLTGMIANLSNGSYTFVTEAGTFENRFDVLYNTEALGTDVPTIDANNVVVVKQGNTIQINSGSVLMNGVTIYDIRGRKVYSVSDINNTQTAISNLTAEQQVLIVEINTVKGKVSKRIVF